MKALFIGGTGIISSACSPLAVNQGIELTLLNRGKSARPTPPGVEVIHGDINNPEEAKKVLGDRKWDVVVNWINFVPSQIERDIEWVFLLLACEFRDTPLLEMRMLRQLSLDHMHLVPLVVKQAE